MNDRILEYASGAVAVEELDIRREGESLVVRIPPPELWRQIIHQLLRGRPHIRHICDLTIDEGGSLRVLIRFIRLRIATDDVTFEEILVPTRPEVASVCIEDNLRDALGLLPANQKSN